MRDFLATMVDGLVQCQNVWVSCSIAYFFYIENTEKPLKELVHLTLDIIYHWCTSRDGGSESPLEKMLGRQSQLALFARKLGKLGHLR